MSEIFTHEWRSRKILNIPQIVNEFKISVNTKYSSFYLFSKTVFRFIDNIVNRFKITRCNAQNSVMKQQCCKILGLFYNELFYTWRTMKAIGEKRKD